MNRPDQSQNLHTRVIFRIALLSWRWLHAQSRLVRWGIKLLFVLLVTVLVLYPKLWLIPTWLHRMRNMNAMLQPDNPELADLETQVRAAVGAEPTSETLLAAVQTTVNRRLPYEFDWNTWGVMDWLPTVDEALHAGKEDCDGRAVVAASLLRRMGHKAWLVSDYTHTWVACDVGETMAPRATKKSLVADDEGTRARVDFSMLENLAHGAAFGVTVFPRIRIVILLAAIVAAACNPWVRGRRQMIGGVMLFGGYACFLIAGQLAHGSDKFPPALVWAGFSLAVIGWLMMVVTIRRASRPDDSATKQPV